MTVYVHSLLQHLNVQQFRRFVHETDRNINEQHNHLSQTLEMVEMVLSQRLPPHKYNPNILESCVVKREQRLDLKYSDEMYLPARDLSMTDILVVCSRIIFIASSTDIIGNGE